MKMLISREAAAAFLIYPISFTVALSSALILGSNFNNLFAVALFLGIPLLTISLRAKYFAVHKHEPLILVTTPFLYPVYVALGIPYYLHYLYLDVKKDSNPE